MNMRRISLLLIVTFMNLSAYSQKIRIDREVSMLALGDSYTIGQSVQVNERWPAQFTEKLSDLGMNAGIPDYIAVTGWTTRDLIQGIGNYLLEDKEYNLVSILIGVNNQYQGQDIGLYRPELTEIIERALEIVGQDTSRVFMLSIPDWAYTPFGNGDTTVSRQIDQYNQINSVMAYEYGIAYVDVTPVSRLGLDQTELVANDGLHPSGLQYGKWVDEIMPWIDTAEVVSTVEIVQPENLKDKALKIIPNPTSSSIQVISDHVYDKIRILDVKGAIIKEIPAVGLPAQIDLSALSPGIYLLEASNRFTTHIIRFVLN
jgi:lysophospholipase L1-like esterase